MDGKPDFFVNSENVSFLKNKGQKKINYESNKNIQIKPIFYQSLFAEDMVKWATKHPNADNGVHLTLTSEWKKYRWPPLSHAENVPGLINPEGKFWHEVPNVVMHASAKEVELEIKAQIDKMIALGHQPSHIDTHMGTLYASPEYVKVFLKVAQEYQIPSNAIDLSYPQVLEYYKKAGYPLTDEVVELLINYSLPKPDNFTSVPNGKTYQEKLFRPI